MSAFGAFPTKTCLSGHDPKADVHAMFTAVAITDGMSKGCKPNGRVDRPALQPKTTQASTSPSDASSLAELAKRRGQLLPLAPQQGQRSPSTRLFDALTPTERGNAVLAAQAV